MFQYHCLNPIAEKGLGLFDEDYKKTEELEGTDAILVRSAKMHDMELPESVKVIARGGLWRMDRSVIQKLSGRILRQSFPRERSGQRKYILPQVLPGSQAGKSVSLL